MGYKKVYQTNDNLKRSSFFSHWKTIGCRQRMFATLVGAGIIQAFEELLYFNTYWLTNVLFLTLQT